MDVQEWRELMQIERACMHLCQHNDHNNDIQKSNSKSFELEAKKNTSDIQPSRHLF